MLLDDIHAAIVSRLAANFPTVVLCEAYPADLDRLPLPALLLELGELEPTELGDDALDGFNGSFTVYCLYDETLAGAELAVRNLAVEVAVRIRQEGTFGQDIERPAEVMRVAEDNMKPELDGYLSWAVDFQLGFTLGEDVWSDQPASGVPVTQVVLGDLSEVHLDHALADPEAPAADDLVNLPDQPKG